MTVELKKLLTMAAVACLVTCDLARGASAVDLLAHVGRTELGEQRGVAASLSSGKALRTLRIDVKEASPSVYVWASIPVGKSRRALAGSLAVEAEITNRSASPKPVMLWVAGRRGWDAVGDSATLKPGETRTYVCSLRDTFPDGTPKLNPNDIQEMRVITRGGGGGSALEVRGLKATGSAPAWRVPEGRLEVPEMQVGRASAGRRVRYQLPADEHTGIYSVLYLPKDWSPNKKYPVIAELPGNIYFANATFSTGRPEQCVLGYGMTKGEGAIWVSLPFIDRKAGTIIEDGWGDADQTADHAADVVEDVCRKFGGDPQNVVLTGFSRGAIACGYIGLRNDRVAKLWKGMHLCQHWDGDGWHGATLEGALERARRFSGRVIFQTDNSNEKTPRGSEKLQEVMTATGAKVTYVESHLGAHACAMFLDDRMSTQELRRWFANLVHQSAAAQ